ncbi:MAG: hypothetical protein M1839_003967 [Geoglossum umbratile]|nr:MAG: hypothetical protein M1839_003967 [Geoglossum umbratile]
MDGKSSNRPLALQIPAPKHRRQSSLESVIDFSHTPLTDNERMRADIVFRRILEEAASAPATNPHSPLNTTKLLEITYQEIPSQEGKDNFLKYVLQNYVSLENDGELPQFLQVLDSLERSPPRPPEWESTSADLAHLLLYKFLLPCEYFLIHLVLSGGNMLRDGDGQLEATQPRPPKPPQVSLRLAATAEHREPFVDDAGQSLEGQIHLSTEVAHIVPHALGESADEASPLSADKSMFWNILKLFHPRMEQTIDGVDIDKPINAMTLSTELHKAFGVFKFYLEETDNKHTYIFKDTPGVRAPVTNFFRPQNKEGIVKFESATGVDLPERGLIALHRACAKIVGLSGAAEYIERLYRDEETMRLRNSDSLLAGGELDLGGLVFGRLLTTRLQMCC